MDRLTKFYKHKSEVLSEQFKIFEQQYKQLLESEAPATVFRGTGAGQHAFSDLELEDQMRKFKKSGIFQQVKDENQTQEYKDAKAELDRRRAAKQTSDTTSTAKASPETVAPPPAPAPTPAPKNSAAKTQAPAPEVSGGEESFLYSTSPKPNTTKPTSAPATKSSSAPQNVQSDEDWKNQERHKGVQDMVRQAFDAVGIGAPGINIDGPPNPRQSSSTATPAAAETNRKVETKTVSVSDEERKKTEKEMSDMTLPDSGVAAGSPNQDIAARGKDVQAFVDTLSKITSGLSLRGTPSPVDREGIIGSEGYPGPELKIPDDYSPVPAPKEVDDLEIRVSPKPKDIETASPTKGSASSNMTTSGRPTGFGKENNTAMQPESTWDEVAQKYVPDNLKGKPLVRKDGKVYAGGVELSTGSMETAGYAKDAPTRKELEAAQNAAKAAPQSVKDYLDRLLLRRYRNPSKA